MPSPLRRRGKVYGGKPERKIKMAEKKKEMTFDSAVKRLEQIVEMLEGGKQTLEKSMELFEEGKALTEFCEQKLKTAKLRVAELCGEEIK